MTAAARAIPAGRWRSSGGVVEAVRRYLPAVSVLVAILVIWELATAGTGRRVLPPPTKILAAAQDNWPMLQRAIQATLFEALGGLVIGTALGLLVAFAAARWAVARDVMLPIAIASSATPGSAS